MTSSLLGFALCLAVVLLGTWPLRRVRYAIMGPACLFGGLVGSIVLTEHLADSPALGHLLLESSARASEALPAEAIDAARPAPPKAELELAPASIEYPADRPQWVEAEFAQDAGDIQKVAISSGPYLRKQEALRALDTELEKAASEYVVSYLGNSAAGTLVPVDAAYIRQHLIRPGNTYSEVIKVSVGPMHQAHALVEFDNDFRRHLDERWKTFVMTGRVSRLAVIAGGVLLALSVVFGYFKADNATRGYHSTRLRMTSAAMLAALAAGGFLLFRAL